MLYTREHQEEDAKGRHRGKVMVHRILSAGHNSLFVTWGEPFYLHLIFPACKTRKLNNDCHC